MSRMLEGKRILVTQAGDFMGPALCDALTAQGAIVVASEPALAARDAASEVVAAAGPVDVLVANLAIAAPTTPAVDVGDDEWRSAFAALVDPLPPLVRAVVPGMLPRGGAWAIR
ncbi:hypothetical protein [Niveibacterium sp. COAC-50]|uniref:hypothetical protein n=1 Tax=Niveibacterium sp. COAC-50 TaxID=2729384 RepID=UPI001551CF53|nr:hypothetical protein [Niveibacterium sp. COAC-50]